MKIPTPIEIMRERVAEAIRTRTSICTHTLGDLADTLRSEVETAGWQVDDRSKPGSWSFGVQSRRRETVAADPPPADTAVADPIKILAYSSAEHTDGTLRASYIDGKCYLHEMRGGSWCFTWLNDNAVALLHQVILTRFRAQVAAAKADGWAGGLRRMGAVVIDDHQVTLDGFRVARSACNITRGGPWYSAEVCARVDGFSVIESWHLMRFKVEAHRLENHEVPAEVRCLALALVAMG